MKACRERRNGIVFNLLRSKVDRHISPGPEDAPSSPTFPSEDGSFLDNETEDMCDHYTDCQAPAEGNFATPRKSPRPYSNGISQIPFFPFTFKADIYIYHRFIANENVSQWISLEVIAILREFNVLVSSYEHIKKMGDTLAVPVSCLLDNVEFILPRDYIKKVFMTEALAKTVIWRPLDWNSTGEKTPPSVMHGERIRQHKILSGGVY